MSWAELLKRVFKIDVEICPKCKGKMKIIASIQDPGVIRKILNHLKLASDPPALEPAIQTVMDFEYY